jgi:uroporphyrinogen-III synthase
MARQSTRVPVPVLLTRPLVQSETFALALQQRFGAAVRPVIAPLMDVAHLRPALPEGPFAGVIFTSANGVAAAAALGTLPGLAWCVGDRTASAAQAAGFRARSAGGNAEALVGAIQADPPVGRLLHLRGEESQGQIAETLNAAGIETLALTVYRQLALPMPAAGLKVLAAAGPVIVPLFSPESGRRLAAAMAGPARADLWLVAMSLGVERAAAGLGRRGLYVAQRPDAEAMLEAVGMALGDTAAP